MIGFGSSRLGLLRGGWWRVLDAGIVDWFAECPRVAGRANQRCVGDSFGDGVRHNVDIVDVPTGATRIVQTKLHTDFGGLRDTVIGGFAIALKDIQVTPGTACVLPYQQWPAEARQSDFGAFYIPLPPSGNCADAITTNIFVAVDANGVVVPGQTNPDGTWKNVSNNPVLTADPQAPPKLTLIPAPAGVHYFSNGIETPLQGVTGGPDGEIGCINGTRLSLTYRFNSSCTIFIPMEVEPGVWVLGSDDELAGCLANGNGIALVEPNCDGSVLFTEQKLPDFRFSLQSNDGVTVPTCLSRVGATVIFQECSGSFDQMWFDADGPKGEPICVGEAPAFGDNQFAYVGVVANLYRPGIACQVTVSVLRVKLDSRNIPRKIAGVKSITKSATPGSPILITIPCTDGRSLPVNIKVIAIGVYLNSDGQEVAVRDVDTSFLSIPCGPNRRIT
jgi:hypothetical protein